MGRDSIHVYATRKAVDTPKECLSFRNFKSDFMQCNYRYSIGFVMASKISRFSTFIFFDNHSGKIDILSVVQLGEQSP